MKSLIYIYLIFFLILFFFNPLIIASSNEQKEPRNCILVFGAHADDVDEIAGGTFAKYLDGGYEGVYVTDHYQHCVQKYKR